jgi:hypothetical protein
MMHPDVVALSSILTPPEPYSDEAHRAVYPAPLADSGGDRFDWDGIAARTGWRYPADYRSFLETYGAGGDFNDHQVEIVSPPPAGVEYQVNPREVRTDREVLCRWGQDDGGDEFYWRCADADPDRWTVAVRTPYPVSDEHWHDCPLGMAAFLTGLLDGSLPIELAVELGDGPYVFASWRVMELEIRAEYSDYAGTWADTAFHSFRSEQW